MEVTNVQDKVSHAVIGMGQVESFGMSEDAELYHILSSALYSRKKEAAVREVLCNAWDSHVEAGITNVPIQITINSEKLIIRDFGSGLAADKIKPVYGTYGKSTKKHDGKQTGGFGLGSKAPFAYVDHFEVISFHDGHKTIYKMSQSNAEVGGKPSISTIVSVPTDETGLQVSFNLKDPADRNEFQALITRIVEMGDMKATLNESELSTIPFSESLEGFMLIKAERFNHSSWAGAVTNSILIRYGHVVYPLNVDERFAHLYKEADEFLQMVSTTEQNFRYNAGRKDWVLVLQAEPHTISVVPSREDLSMTDKTVNTVKGLLTKFLRFSNGKLEATCTDMFEEAVSKIWLAATPQMLFQDQRNTPLIDLVKASNSNFVYDFEKLSRHYLKSTYPRFSGFRTKDLNIRVNSLIQSGFGNRGMLQSFKNELVSKSCNSETVSSWFHRKFINLALRGAVTTKAIDPERLFVYTTVSRGRYGNSKEPGFIPAVEWVAPTVEKCLPFLRNMVILTHTRTSHSLDRLNEFPICKHWLGKPLNSLCYMVPRNTEKTTRAREHFERLGFTILDLTVAQPWERTDVVAPIVRAAPKPRKKGLICLKAGWDNVSGGFITDRLWQPNADRIENPEFVVKMSSRTTNSSRFPEKYNLDTGVTYAIVRLYGHLGAVVQNKSQEDKQFDLGAKNLKIWLVEKILEEYENNPLIKQHYQFSITHRDEFVNFGYSNSNFYNVVRRDIVLRKHFSLNAPLVQNEKDIISIYESFRHYERRDYAQLIELDKLVKTWGLDPNVQFLLDKIRASKISHMVDANNASLIFQNDNKIYSPKEVQAARDILLLALEG